LSQKYPDKLTQQEVIVMGNPLKGILPSTVFALGPLIVKKLTEIGCITLESGVKVDCTNKRIGISGFGTKVFSDYIDNVFFRSK